MSNPQHRDADFERTYRRLAPELERQVARLIRAPRPVIEEACQVAWARLVGAEQPLAARAVPGWLLTTAAREAVHALRAQRREVPLERDGEVIELPARDPGPDGIAELRGRLAEIRRLPVRQQRVVWLHGLGYEYSEIAERTGDSRRTVERQLLRAKRTLARLAA